MGQYHGCRKQQISRPQIGSRNRTREAAALKITKDLTTRNLLGSSRRGKSVNFLVYYHILLCTPPRGCVTKPLPKFTFSPYYSTPDLSSIDRSGLRFWRSLVPIPVLQICPEFQSRVSHSLLVYLSPSLSGSHRVGLIK